MDAKPKNQWVENADVFIAGAKRAQEAGDIAAVLELVSGAAQCLAVARNLERADAARTKAPSND